MPSTAAAITDGMDTVLIHILVISYDGVITSRWKFMHVGTHGQYRIAVRSVDERRKRHMIPRSGIPVADSVPFSMAGSTSTVCAA